MNWYGCAKRYTKELIAAGILLGLFTFGSSAMAEDKPGDIKTDNTKSDDVSDKSYTLPERKIEFDFKNPIASADANTKAWYSLNQLAGAGSDAIGKSFADYDKTWRYMSLGGQALAGIFISTASHECAHAREIDKYGKPDFHLGFISVAEDANNTTITDKQDLKTSVAGLNQCTLNSCRVFRNSGKSITFNDALTFLILEGYGAASAIKDSTGYEGDVHDITTSYKKMGIDFSRSDYMREKLIANALSFHTYKCLWATEKYIAGGEREITATSCDIFGVEFTPPLISYYLTEKGGFYNIICIAEPSGKNPVEFNLGTGANFTQHDKVDKLRIGGQYHNIGLVKETPNLAMSPFIHINLDTSGRYDGFSAGTDATMTVYKDLLLTGKLGYNKHDVIENDVKGKDSGPELVFGISLRF